MLRTKFKNLRRPARADKAGITVPPPLKRTKRMPCPADVTFTYSDVAEYKRHVSIPTTLKSGRCQGWKCYWSRRLHSEEHGLKMRIHQSRQCSIFGRSKDCRFTRTYNIQYVSTCISPCIFVCLHKSAGYFRVHFRFVAITYMKSICTYMHTWRLFSLQNFCTCIRCSVNSALLLENGMQERYEDRVLLYAPLEQKRVVKELLDEVKLNDEDNEGNTLW